MKKADRDRSLYPILKLLFANISDSQKIIKILATGMLHTV